MKTKTFLMLLICILLYACSDSDKDPIPSPDDIVPDPEGTVLISIMNKDNGNNHFRDIYISNAGNFYGVNWTFSGLGKMMGLGNVVTIPQSGYVDEYLARTGYGYVGKEEVMNYHRSSYECNFIRFWVDYASETGAEVKYQYPFIGLNNGIQPTSDKIVLENVNMAQGIVELKEMAPFKATITSNDVAHGWLQLSKSEKGAFAVVAKSENLDVSPREATITIKGSGSDSKKVKVVQHGAAAFISISNTNIVAPPTASDGTLEVTSNTKWTISSDVSWCTVDPLSVHGRGVVNYSIQQNNTGEKRVAKITFSAQGAENVYVTITQDLFFSGGSGILGDPYIVTNSDQLALISKYSTSYFRMINDIDLTEYLRNSAMGWTPFYFKGDFDGNGYQISGLWINRSSDQNVGLFSEYHGGNKTIGNLTINLDSKGISGGENTGGIAGKASSGNITNCFVNGTITGGNNTGGVVGYLYDYFTIKNCSVNGSITGTTYTGGIVGGIFSSISISTCNFRGTVSGINAGGILGKGFYNTIINHSYSIGNVNGTIAAGGLIGVSNGCGPTDSYSTAKVTVKGFNYACYAGGIIGYGGGTVSRCYYAGTLNVSYTTGGSETKVGIASGNSITSSYYDSSIAGENITDVSNGRTATQMKQKSTYSGWDFNEIWDILEGVSYPSFKSNSQ